MRSTRPAPARRRRALLTLTPLVLLLPLLAPTTAAQAAKPTPVPPPPPATLVVTDIDSTITTPLTAGSPTDFIAKGEPFSVLVEVRAGAEGPLTTISNTKDVTLSLSVVGGTSTVGSTTVLKGASTATFTNLVLTTAANNVQLRVTATAPAKEAKAVVSGLSPVFDVAVDFDPVDGFRGNDGVLVSREGLQECTATPERPSCVDLVLPPSTTNGDLAFFSTGVCDAAVGCDAARNVLQVLAAFELPRTSPATAIVKCDKSLCGGGAIRDNVLRVNLAATGLLADATPCTTKGVVDQGVDFCVDYVQSKRDGSGDTYLYLLMIRDARMSI